MVEIRFDCLPLRTISRRNIPLDATDEYRAFCQRVFAAMDRHGTLNSYYLHQATCDFQLLNHPSRGRLEFEFEGTVLTNQSDLQTISADLQIELLRETCDWISEPVVEWFKQTVQKAVIVEFDRYIAQGSRDKAEQRIKKLNRQMEEGGGFIGMYL